MGVIASRVEPAGWAEYPRDSYEDLSFMFVKDKQQLPDQGAASGTTHAPAATDKQTIFFSSKIHAHRDALGNYLSLYPTYAAADSLDKMPGFVPITMELDLTNSCTHHCPLCVGCRLPNRDSERLYKVAGDGESIPTLAAVDYIKQMVEAGVKGLIFTGGGEPTIHPDLVHLISVAHRSGLDVGLITHGGLLHKHDIGTLVARCTWIRISVDAANEKEFMAVHGANGKEWHRVWENICRLTNEKQNQVTRSICATIGVGFLAGPHNVHHVGSLAERARESRVDYLQVRPFHHCASFDASGAINDARSRFNTDKFSVVGSLQKYLRLRKGQPEPRTYRYCHITQFASVIGADEKMYACCHTRNQPGYCIGDLRRDSLVDILQSLERARCCESIDVNNCLELCRGDHVNRQIEELLATGQPLRPPIVQPMHVNFL